MKHVYYRRKGQRYAAQKGTKVSNLPLDDLGKQIKDSVKQALQSGDFSDLKDIGQTAGKMMKNFNQSTQNPANNGGQHRHQGGQNQPQQPYEPEVGPRPQPQNQQQFTGKPAWAGSAWRGFGGSKKRKNPFSMLPMVLGGIAMVPFGLLFIIASLATAAGSAAGVGIGLSLMGLLSGGISVAVGASRRSLGFRINRYYELLEQKNVQTIAELAASTFRPVGQVEKDIQKALDRQLMPGVWLDNSGTTVMLGAEAHDLYLQTEKDRKTLEQDKAEQERRMENPETAELERFKADGVAALRSIHEANDAIADEEMSAKMDRLETVAGKIFAYVKENPGKLPETRKLMEYYLPTTLKLLREYQRYDEMDVAVPSVIKAKKEISDTLDTVNLAFENLLESLYHDDTLDVKTDIKVLQAMLQQEGLTGGAFELDAEDNKDTILHF